MKNVSQPASKHSDHDNHPKHEKGDSKKITVCFSLALTGGCLLACAVLAGIYIFVIREDGGKSPRTTDEQKETEVEKDEDTEKQEEQNDNDTESSDPYEGWKSYQYNVGMILKYPPDWQVEESDDSYLQSFEISSNGYSFISVQSVAMGRICLFDDTTESEKSSIEREFGMDIDDTISQGITWEVDEDYREIQNTDGVRTYRVVTRSDLDNPTEGYSTICISPSNLKVCPACFVDTLENSYQYSYPLNPDSEMLDILDKILASIEYVQ